MVEWVRNMRDKRCYSELGDGPRPEQEPASNRLAIEVDIPDHYSAETLEQTRKAIELLAEYAQLFAAKQEAYGRGNIDGFGELGALVRLNDKVERLKNLIYRGKANDLEAIEDTWLDVVGYGLIGLMIHRGRW